MKKIFLLFVLLCYLIYPQSFTKKVYYYFNSDMERETIAWQSRVVNNGGSVSFGTLLAVNDFVKDVASIRSKLVRVNLFCGDQLAAAQIPLFFNASGSIIPDGKTKDSLINVVAGDYTEATGLQFGATKVLHTGLIPNANSTIGQNDVHCSVVVANNAQASLGDIYTGTALLLYSRYTDNKMYYRVNASTDDGAVASTNSIGFWLISRLNGTNEYAYKNGSEVHAGVKASVSESSTQFILATGMNRLFRGYTIGAGLTAGEVSLLNTAIEKFNDALSRGVQ